MILFLSVFPPYRGGISRFSDYLCRHLQPTTEVTAVNFLALYPKILFPGSTQFYDAATHSNYALRQMHSYNPFNWRKTSAYIVQQKPEVLLLSYWHPFFIPGYARVIKLVKKELPNIKVITIAHNVVPHEGFPFSTKLLRHFFEKNDLVLTLSAQTKGEFETLNTGTALATLFHPVYESDIKITESPALRKKYNFDKDDRIILFFGLIREYKGLDVLINALNSIDIIGKRIKPLIVGEFYDDKQKYLNLIKPEHRHQYTIIDRFVTDTESTEVMSIANLLALPYKNASQSGVLADALNYELPAVVSNHKGIIEYIDDEKNGLIFDSEDTAMLAEKISTYFEDKEIQTNIRQNLRQLKERLSWAKFVEELNKYLIKQ